MSRLTSPWRPGAGRLSTSRCRQPRAGAVSNAPSVKKKEAHAAILDHLLRRLPGRQEAPDASATGLRAGDDCDAGRSRLLALDTAHLGPKRTRQRSMAQVSAATLREIRSLAPDSGQRPAASGAVRPRGRGVKHVGAFASWPRGRRRRLPSFSRARTFLNRTAAAQNLGGSVFGAAPASREQDKPYSGLA